MTTKLSRRDAAVLAAEAAASLRQFGRLGYSSVESLLGRAEGSVRLEKRRERVDRHRLGLKAMGAAVRDAANEETIDSLRRLLFASAEALEALSREESLTPASARRFG